MKRKLLIILSIIILIIGGYFILNEYKKKRLVNEAQEKAEEYVLENFEDVESIQIISDNYHFDPMGVGGFSVGGYINNNEDLSFNALLTVDGNKVQEVTSIVTAPNFPDRRDEK